LTNDASRSPRHRHARAREPRPHGLAADRTHPRAYARQALADGSPDPVVHWSRMVRHAHPAAAVVALIDTACRSPECSPHVQRRPRDGSSSSSRFVKAPAHAITATIHPFPETPPAKTADSKFARDAPPLATTRPAATPKRRANGPPDRQRLGLPPAMTERTVRAGVLHDVGKIAFPDAILFKEARSRRRSGRS